MVVAASIAIALMELHKASRPSSRNWFLRSSMVVQHFCSDIEHLTRAFTLQLIVTAQLRNTLKTLPCMECDTWTMT